jgi:hypothetical protein
MGASGQKEERLLWWDEDKEEPYLLIPGFPDLRITPFRKEDDPHLVSVTMGLGSWFMGLGSWFMGHGTWVWVMGLGSWFMGHGTWDMGHGSWVVVCISSRPPVAHSASESSSHRSPLDPKDMAEYSRRVALSRSGYVARRRDCDKTTSSWHKGNARAHTPG